MKSWKVHLFILVFEPERSRFSCLLIFAAEHEILLYLYPRENLPQFSCSAVFARRGQAKYPCIYLYPRGTGPSTVFVYIFTLNSLNKPRRRQVTADASSETLMSLPPPQEQPSNLINASVSVVLWIAKWLGRCLTFSTHYENSVPLSSILLLPSTLPPFLSSSLYCFSPPLICPAALYLSCLLPLLLLFLLSLSFLRHPAEHTKSYESRDALVLAPRGEWLFPLVSWINRSCRRVFHSS